ncbi:MAG: DUF983 domain-containing protein [Planctomycetota bacterium]
MQPPRSLFLRCLLRALRGRCPACGLGKVTRRYTNLVRSCPRCGWILEREPGAITGAMYLTAILTQFAAVAVMLLCWALTDWSTTRIIVTGLPILIVFSVVALAWSKRIWIAVEFWTDMNSDEAADNYEQRAFVDPE